MLKFDFSALDDMQRSDAVPVPLFRQTLAGVNDTLRHAFLSGVDASLLVHHRSEAIDALLKKAWNYHLGTQNIDTALIAVGGYGRNELHPGSDIDLLILLRHAPNEQTTSALQLFLTLLWDMGLDIGHSVRTVAECVAEALNDITIATNLTEARLVEGPIDLFNEMVSATGPEYIWPSRKYFEAKWAEQIARHHKYHDAVSNLEPNVKEGPGGLRDIQMIGWVAKRHFGASTLHDLVIHRFLTETEYQSLMQCQDFLWRVRTGLHTLTNRREDRLLFDHQKALAKQFGYRDTEHRLAVEHFMKDYYISITELHRLNEVLLQLFQEAILHADDTDEPIPLNKRFQIRKGFIEATSPNVFKQYPFALFEIFLLLQQHQETFGVRASTIRLMRDHRHLIDEKFRNDIRNRSLFMEIFRQPCGLTHQVRCMNRYGILAEYIPAFGKVVGLMQYDLFHVYTVDEHSLMVLRNVRRLTVETFARENPFASKLIKRIPKLEILYFAALFHDIAKGRGGDHSKLGADEALEFCAHHGMSDYDARFVAWLVKHHLAMSSTAQRQDISDPDIIANFAQLIGDHVHLNYLYLLTIADIRGTNPEMWNNWKDALLQELFFATSRALRRGLGNPIDKAARIEETQAQAQLWLDKYKLSQQQIHAVWDNFSEDYFLRHTPDEIAWHTRSIAANDELNVPLVLTRHDTERGATAIFLYTHDQDFLFAAATQALDRMNLDIVDARIITTKSGFVLDTFIVLDAQGEAIDEASQLRQIETRLKAALSNTSKQAVLSTRPIPRRLKAFPIPTEITFSTDLANQRTVMELIAADRPGFLSIVGQVLVECEVRLQNAKISTFGARVEDVFFLTDDNDQPLRDKKQFACLEERIKHRLEEDRS